MPVIQITMSQGRSRSEVLTKETARIMKTQEEKVRILIYEVSKGKLGKLGSFPGTACSHCRGIEPLL